MGLAVSCLPCGRTLTLRGEFICPGTSNGQRDAVTQWFALSANADDRPGAQRADQLLEVAQGVVDGKTNHARESGARFRHGDFERQGLASRTEGLRGSQAPKVGAA